MTKLKTPIKLETTFAEYVLTEQIGEGGAGRVYGATDPDGSPVAIKVLTAFAKDKRKRFQNEIAFLQGNKHTNIVPILDHGLASSDGIKGPFYVMPRYKGNFRDVLNKGIRPDHALSWFIQILDGVEAAHLKGAVHRDLKPENMLVDNTGAIAIADFGIASFREKELLTLVETGPTDRLANFLYAAPEQRKPGNQITGAADIYALGLILNEMFTGSVPHGTDYRLIESVAPELAFLDTIVDRMIKQSPAERLNSVDQVKSQIENFQAVAISRQKLSQIDSSVIKAGEIDDPSAITPPVVVSAQWEDEVLIITLSYAPSDDWGRVLRTAHYSHNAVGNSVPQSVQINGRIARMPARGNAQAVKMALDNFKNWLPIATFSLRNELEAKLKNQEAARRQELKRQKEAEERSLSINKILRT